MRRKNLRTYIYLGECKLEDEQLSEFLELGQALKLFDEEKSNIPASCLKKKPEAHTIQLNVVDQIETDKHYDEKTQNETETNSALNYEQEIPTVFSNQ